MKTRFRTYTARRSSGVTLIEAVAGTALLGTLLVSVLVADARLRRQSRSARLRAEACAIADGFLRNNWDRRAELLMVGEGGIPGKRGWRWRASPADIPGAERLDGRGIALEIIPPDRHDPAVQLALLVARPEKQR